MTEVETIENDEVKNATGFDLSDNDDFGDHKDDHCLLYTSRCV